MRRLDVVLQPIAYNVRLKIQMWPNFRVMRSSDPKFASFAVRSDSAVTDHGGLSGEPPKQPNSSPSVSFFGVQFKVMRMKSRQTIDQNLGLQ